MTFKITSSFIIFSRNLRKQDGHFTFFWRGGRHKTDFFPFDPITNVHALKKWKHAYLDLSISERTKIDLQSKVQKAKVLFWKNFLPGGDSEYSLFPPGDQGVWGGRHIRGQRKIPLGHTVTTITLRIGQIAFLRSTIVIFSVARISTCASISNQMLSIVIIPLHGPRSDVSLAL